MKLKTIFCCAFVLLTGILTAAPISQKTKTYKVDLCIYGTTSAGVMAAYAAAKCGKSVLLVGPAKMIGGMTTGGLGKTDSGKKDAITGLSRQFYRDVGKKKNTDFQKCGTSNLM